MRIVLDTNQFIFALGKERDRSCVKLFDILTKSTYSHSIHIPRTVFLETRQNLSPLAFMEFLKFVAHVATIDEDEVVPYEYAVKYLSQGFKQADSLIAAYSEFITADILVSENRHFLARSNNLPFKVLSAEKALKLL